MPTAKEAKMGELYLTPNGMPVKKIAEDDKEVTLLVEALEKSYKVRPMFLLKPYNPLEVTRDMKLFVANKYKEEDDLSLSSINKRRKKVSKRHPASSSTHTVTSTPDSFKVTWGGKEYLVTVKDGKYNYEGTLHKSLTSVARIITGKKVVNGPKFFGLR